MAEEFQAAICGGTTATTWWNPSRTVLSPCSVAEFGFNLMNDHHHNQMGSYGWSTSNDDHIVDPKSTTSINNSNIVSRSSNCDQESNNSVISGDSSVIFQNQKTTDSDSGGSSSIFMDSTFNMMGFGLPSSSTSSSPTDWNHALLHENVRGGEDNNYGSMIQEDMINNHDSSSSTVHNISQGLYGYPSTLLQAGLFEPNQTQQQQQSCLFNNRSINNYLSTVNNYRPKSNDVVLSTASWTKPTASFQKQQPSSLQFNNNTPFWNASTTGFLPNSSPSQLISPTVGNNKLNSFSTLTTKCNNNHEEVRDSGSVVKKGSSEPAFKRPRIETPSPLPTFKVRKEKLGDRITALQQLVSPFGKTDTASVLHEAIEYIKYLHDQVSVLSTPYMKPGNPIQQQQGAEKLMKDAETPKQDLRSRGLCLVPISSTFPVANVTTPDFWTPTFGGSYR